MNKLKEAVEELLKIQNRTMVCPSPNCMTCKDTESRFDRVRDELERLR